MIAVAVLPDRLTEKPGGRGINFNIRKYAELGNEQRQSHGQKTHPVYLACRKFPAHH